MSLTTIVPSYEQLLTTLWHNVTEAPESYVSSAPEPDQEYVKFREQSRFWVQRVLAPIVMTIGVVGNTISIVVLTRRRMRSSTNCYLAALAIFDMLYLILFFSLSLKHYPNTNTQDYYLYYKCYGVMLMLTDACSNTSVWLTATFTIERYIAVCHPIKRKVICTESRAKKVVFAVFFLCFSFTITTPFEWTVKTEFNAETNRTIVFPTYSDLGHNIVYKNIYYWVTVVLFIFIPFVLLAVFNSFLIWAVHQSKSQRRLMTMTKTQRDSANQENKITIMLIAVVMLFLICQLPTAAMLVHSVTNVYPRNSNPHAIIRGLNNIFNILMAVNASSNFVLYCVLSEKFRRTFRKVFCPCEHRRRRPDRYGRHSTTTMVDYDVSSVTGHSSASGRRRSSAATSRSPPTSTTSSGGRRPDLILHEKSNYLTVPGSKSIEKKKSIVCANHRLNGKEQCIVASSADGCSKSPSVSNMKINPNGGNKVVKILSRMPKISWFKVRRQNPPSLSVSSEISDTGISRHEVIVTTESSEGDTAFSSI